MPTVLDKTLIIRLSSIGDIVLTSLLVRVFRKRFPECRLDFVVKEQFAELVRGNPHITNIITFPNNGAFADLRQLRSRLRQEQYDLIVDIHDSLRSRFLSFGAKRVVRIDKRTFERFLLVNLKLNWYEKFGDLPSVPLRYLEPVKSFGIEDDGKGLEIFYSDADKHQIAQLVQSKGFKVQQDFIGICPSARHNNKMWLAERFAEVAVRLNRQVKSPIVLFGSEDESERCEQIAARVKVQNPAAQVLNLAGTASLTETAAMMDKCSIVITNDSGLMHIAAARKRNVVAIFGPTVKELGFFPFGTTSIVVENTTLECRPCTHIGLPSCPKGHFKCMNDISTQQVVDAAAELLRTA